MPFTVTLEPEVESRLETLATKTGQDKSVLLQMAIENGIDDITDYFTASEVLERVKHGKEKTFTSREMRVELGLED